MISLTHNSPCVSFLTEIQGGNASVPIVHFCPSGFHTLPDSSDAYLARSCIPTHLEARQR